MELHTHNRLNILFRSSFRQLLKVSIDRITEEIKGMSNDLLAQKDIDELVTELFEQNKYGDLPIIYWEKGTSKISNINITAKDLPRKFDRGFNGTIEKKKIDIFIPLGEGRDDLMVYAGETIDYSQFSSVKMSFSTKSFNPVGVPYVIDKNKLQFTYIDFWDDPDKTNTQFIEDKNLFQEFHDSLKKAIEDYNSNLPDIIAALINQKRKKLKQENEYKSKLIFPVVSDPNISDSFKPKRILKSKKIQPKPKKISPTNAIHEWYITEEDYFNILKLLYDCGKMWEKYPRLYKGRDEETLRDQLLFVLVPNINAVVAGEAYNKRGKTDISIKQENTNLFIGECKIWKGPKTLLETIDQILKYLTWRDSKSAILNFVPNANFTDTLQSAQETIKLHPNYVRKLKNYEKGWDNYTFRLDKESNVYLTIAFQFIHTPELYETKN